MEKQARKRSNNWVIAVESRNDQHQEIILATIASVPTSFSKGVGTRMALMWMTAEKELLQNDLNGNTSQFDLFIESPRDPKVTTILSMTTHSMIRSHARHAGEVGGGPDVASVHLFPEEIDTTKTNVNGVDGLLHVQVPKKNHRNST